MRLLAVVLVACCWTGIAAAETPQERAGRLFAEGRELLTRRNDARGACERFEQAIALDPTAPGVMLNLGLCYELLDRYATSLYWFRKAQAAAAEAQLPAYENEAKKHTVELINKVATARIDPAGLPAEADVRIDGKRIAPTDYARIEVDPGTRAIEVRAPGKQPYFSTFEVVGRDAGAIGIALVDERAPANSPAPAPRGRGRKIAAASLAAAGAGLCIASPIWAYSLQQSADRKSQDEVDSATTKQHIATGMFVGGLVAAGIGAYLFFTAPSSAEPRTAIAPLVGNDQLGLAVGGSF